MTVSNLTVWDKLDRAIVPVASADGDYVINTTPATIAGGAGTMTTLSALDKLNRALHPTAGLDGDYALAISGGASAVTTTKGDLAGFSTVAARIPIGTDGQVLTADSTQALGLKWATVAAGVLTTKGDLVVFTTVTARLAVGADGTVLTATSGAASGLAWTAPAAAAAGSLTGATLAANVLASSLTSVGVLAAPHMTSPVVDSGGLTITSGSLVVTAGSANTITGVATAGGATLLTLTPGAHTAVVAEVNNIVYAGQTMTITGGYATQRFVRLNAPTITAGSALTVTTAATLAIVAAPIAAGSAVITTSLALWVQAGKIAADGGIGTTTGSLAFTSAAGFTFAPTAGSGVTFTGAAVAAGANLITWTPGAHTAVVAEVIDYNYAVHTMTITGSYATQRFAVFDIPTVTAASTFTITTMATVAIVGAPAVAGSAVGTNKYAFWVQAGTSRFDAPLFFYRPSGDINLITTTDMVGALSTAGNIGDIAVRSPSTLYLFSGAVTVFYTAAILRLTVGSAGITLSDAHNIVVSATTGTKIGTATTQKLGFWNAAPIVQPTDGAALTNSVTAGGTTDTIANFTDLTIYANDAAAIRNDIYQLARKIKLVSDAVRLMGLMS